MTIYKECEKGTNQPCRPGIDKACKVCFAKCEQSHQAERATASCLSGLLWRDISSAPKTGERVLLYNGNGNGNVGVGSFHKWSRDDNGSVVGYEDIELNDYWEWDGEGFKVDPEPTHFMQLPEAP